MKIFPTPFTRVQENQEMGEEEVLENNPMWIFYKFDLWGGGA